MRKLWITSLFAVVIGLSGCTVYGVKNPPTLKTTTSAEQYEQILWSAVKAKNWGQVPGMLAANLMYSVGGKVLSKDQVVPYLKGLNLADYTIPGMALKPTGTEI